MGFRTVVIKSRCKLEARLNYLVVRGEEEKRIYLHEINTLIVQSTAVSLTAALLCELTKNGVKVIFCDEKCNPNTELIPYYGVYNCTKHYKQQVLWRETTKQVVWKEIIRQKIGNQAKLLDENGFRTEADLLRKYHEEVQDGDSTNREGHAAKVYFNCLLPIGVSRRSNHTVNTYLNYGYAILLSAFNREVVASGYLTQFGIWHCGEQNPYNLSCDLMEPLRSTVDRVALHMEDEKTYKRTMINIMNYEVIVGEKTTTMDLGIREYVKSVLFALDNDCPEAIEYIYVKK